MRMVAAAKINLGLKVLNRRPDGYHNLESVMQQVSLADYLTFERVSSPGWQFKSTVPRLGGEDNLVCRAARFLAKRVGASPPGVKITLYKNIPSGAGLGGGSSDAAATLRGLNIFWRLGLSSRELAELGASLGSDIPFFLHGGGTAFARGRGELISPLPPLPLFWVVLAKPSRLSISTASVYGGLEEKMSPVLSPNILREAILKADREAILNWLGTGAINSLQSSVLTCYPRLGRLRRRMGELGLKAAMSGSGPTFFALSNSYSLARQAAQILQAEGYRAILCWTVQRTVTDR